jgi:hypothetical protein
VRDKTLICGDSIDIPCSFCQKYGHKTFNCPYI